MTTNQLIDDLHTACLEAELGIDDDFAPPTEAAIQLAEKFLGQITIPEMLNCMISPDGMGGISVYWRVNGERLTLRIQESPLTSSLFKTGKVWRAPSFELVEKLWTQTFGDK